MRHIASISAAGDGFGLYLISKPDQFQIETLHTLYNLGISQKRIFSIERLFKELEQALVIFMPKTFLPELGNLGLVELEDYIPATSLVWQSEYLQGKYQSIKVEDLQLNSEQRFCIQIIARPYRNNFKINLRYLVSDRQTLEKVNLAKKINQIFIRTGIIKNESMHYSENLLLRYKNREYIGKKTEIEFKNLYQILTTFVT